MEIQYKETNLKQLTVLVEEYIQSLTGVIDDFAEEQIMHGTLRVILADGVECGFFSVEQGWENDGNYITCFYLREACLCFSQQVFSEILSTYQVTKSLVATCDELFLSLSLDYHKSVQMQACFFDGTIPHTNVRPAEFPRECLKPLQESDFALYETLGESFFGPVSKEILETSGNYYFKLEKDGEIYGYGYIAPNQLKTGYWATGLIVVNTHRCQGAGRSIQMHLEQFCREHGVIPIGGCWYYNYKSKLTFESSGRYTKTRYLNITLDPKLIEKKSVNIKD